MHRLHRQGVDVPGCLALYRAEHDWDDVAPACKAEIRAQLMAMQAGPRCAYCESETYGHHHIEHFRRKRDYPALTFEWKNLFLSCSEADRCGCFKDRSSGDYNPNDLIKPDEDEPDDFLYFHSNGDVRVRSGIGAAAEKRARETIRVFNLNSPALRHLRRLAVRFYERANLGVWEFLESATPEERRTFIEGELRSEHGLANFSPIRHLLSRSL